MIMITIMKITIIIQVQRLPPLGGGKQSWRQRHMGKSWRPLQTCCTGRHGEDRRSPASFVRPVCQAATPLCLPGTQLLPLFWRAQSFQGSHPHLPKSSKMPSLLGIWGPPNRALWPMSYQQVRSPESVALLLSGYWQDLPPVKGTQYYVCRRKPEAWAGGPQPAPRSGQMRRKLPQLYA